MEATSQTVERVGQQHTHSDRTLTGTKRGRNHHANNHDKYRSKAGQLRGEHMDESEAPAIQCIPFHQAAISSGRQCMARTKAWCSFNASVVLGRSCDADAVGPIAGGIGRRAAHCKECQDLFSDTGTQVFALQSLTLPRASIGRLILWKAKQDPVDSSRVDRFNTTYTTATELLRNS
jgi:hypothetical protein